MNNPYYDTGMPIELAMELSRNIDAMGVFATMTKEEKSALISRARAIKTKEEIKSIVDAMLHTDTIG